MQIKQPYQEIAKREFKMIAHIFFLRDIFLHSTQGFQGALARSKDVQKSGSLGTHCLYRKLGVIVIVKVLLSRNG